jgi:hypothetical protein
VDPCRAPVNVAEPQLHDVAGAQSQACEQQQNRAIALADGRPGIAGGDDAFHIVGRQVARQRRQSPMDKDGDGPSQAAGAPAFGDHKPEKHPKRRRALLGRRPPVRAAALEHKLSQAPRVPRARLLADSCEELAEVPGVIRQGALTGPALLVHPLAESSDQQRRGDGAFHSRTVDQARILQVHQEKARAMQDLHPERMPEVRASTGSLKVTTESIQRRSDRAGDRNPPAIRPMGEVLRGSEMSAGGDRRIAVSHQHLRERFQQRPSRSFTK